MCYDEIKREILTYPIEAYFTHNKDVAYNLIGLRFFV